MDCNNASSLMMKYMDNMLTDSEATELGIHINVCSSCKEDFDIYTAISDEFAADSAILFEAPDDFEALVMAEISLLEAHDITPATKDTFMGFVLGISSMIFGLGLTISMYKEQLLDFASGYPWLSDLITGASRISDLVFSQINSFTIATTSYFSTFNSLIVNSKYVILFIVAALTVAQYVLYTKSNKAEA